MHKLIEVTPDVQNTEKFVTIHSIKSLLRIDNRVIIGHTDGTYNSIMCTDRNAAKDKLNRLVSLINTNG